MGWSKRGSQIFIFTTVVAIATIASILVGSFLTNNSGAVEAATADIIDEKGQGNLPKIITLEELKEKACFGRVAWRLWDELSACYIESLAFNQLDDILLAIPRGDDQSEGMLLELMVKKAKTIEHWAIINKRIKYVPDKRKHFEDLTKSKFIELLTELVESLTFNQLDDILLAIPRSDDQSEGILLDLMVKKAETIKDWAKIDSRASYVPDRREYFENLTKSKFQELVIIP